MYKAFTAIDTQLTKSIIMQDTKSNECRSKLKKEGLQNINTNRNNIEKK